MISSTDIRDARDISAFMRGTDPWSDSGGPTEASSELPAGFVYFGQLVTHDLLGRLRNGETATTFAPEPPHRLDLRCIYGDPPYGKSGLFHPDGRFRTCATDGSRGRVKTAFDNDVPLDEAGQPLIAVPRNDSNLILSQLHVAFLKLHNAIVVCPDLVDPSLDHEARVARAREIAVWHYRSVILDDFLPRVCDPQQLHLARTPVARPSFSRDVSWHIPAMFRFAALRFGHSQIGDYYDLNRCYRSGSRTSSPIDLNGLLRHRTESGKAAPIRSDWVVDWRRFFSYPHVTVSSNAAQRIGTRLAARMFELPPTALPDDLTEGDACFRDLRRQSSEQLPSGQVMARHLGVDVLVGAEQVGVRLVARDPRTGAEIPDTSRNERLNRNTPLWYYILVESMRQQDGLRLGQVGTRIVADTLYCLLYNEPTSPLHDDGRRPIPRIPGCERHHLEMWQLLSFAGVTNPLGDDSGS